MTREQFQDKFRQARTTGRASRISHNGRNWTVSKLNIDRLDSHGCFDRVGQHALTLAHAADCRKKPGFARSARVLVSMAREYRESAQ